MSSVTLEKLVKRYGKVDAVRGIDLAIADGEFMAFLGPSGCGKTSTMRMIAGLEEITDGVIYFDDKSVNRVRPRERGVAMAFESYALYPTLSVYENLAFPLRAQKWNGSDIDRRVRGDRGHPGDHGPLNAQARRAQQRSGPAYGSGVRVDAQTGGVLAGRTHLPSGYPPACPDARLPEASPHGIGPHHDLRNP